jgi:hypothetical protein
MKRQSGRANREGKSKRKTRKEAWQNLERLWATVHVNSGGDRLTRDQLHKRHLK